MSAATTTHSFEDDVNLYFDRAAAFTDHPKGLLDQIRACNSIHTFFMKFSIDVVFCDGDLVVRKVLQNVVPGKMPWPVWSARTVFEFSSGFLEKNPIHVGDRLHVDT